MCCRAPCGVLAGVAAVLTDRLGALHAATAGSGCAHCTAVERGVHPMPPAVVCTALGFDVHLPAADATDRSSAGSAASGGSGSSSAASSHGGGGDLYDANRLWFLGRVKWEADARASGAAASQLVPFVYWFEPCLVPDDAAAAAEGGRIMQALRRERLADLAGVAPAGTYSLAFVPGMAVETRRVGGKWAATAVVAASRRELVVRGVRPPPDADSNADKPRDAPNFGRGAARVHTVAPPPATSASGSGDAGDVAHWLRVHRGRLSNAGVKTSPSSSPGDGRAARMARVARAGTAAAAATSNGVSPASAGAGVEPVAGVQARVRAFLDTTRSLATDAAAAVADDGGAPLLTLPRQRWVWTVARAGHYCGGGGGSGAPPAPARRASMFGIRRPSSAALVATSAVTAAAFSTIASVEAGTLAVPPAAGDRLRRKSVVEGMFGR